jgi:hypothetical protein
MIEHVDLFERINSTISEKIKTQSQVVSIVCLYLFLPLGIQLLRVEGWNLLHLINVHIKKKYR